MCMLMVVVVVGREAGRVRTGAERLAFVSKGGVCACSQLVAGVCSIAVVDVVVVVVLLLFAADADAEEEDDEEEDEEDEDEDEHAREAASRRNAVGEVGGVEERAVGKRIDFSSELWDEDEDEDDDEDEDEEDEDEDEDEDDGEQRAFFPPAFFRLASLSSARIFASSSSSSSSSSSFSSFSSSVSCTPSI